MVRSLRETLLDALGDASPFFKRDDHFLRVFALFVGEGAEEGNEVVGDVVLHGGAVADGVDGAEGGAVEAEVGVGFEGVAVGLVFEFGGDAFAEFGLGWKEVKNLLVGDILKTVSEEDVPTPVDQRQKPIGSSFVIISPFSPFCVNRILSGRTSLTREFVRTSTWSWANLSSAYFDSASS